MIAACEIGKDYGSNEVLKNISVSFETGAVTALVGANGAGKSTLLRILSGALRPSSGEVLVGSSRSPIRSVRQARKMGVRFADQEGSLIPSWTVREHFLRLTRIEAEKPWHMLAPAVEGSEFVRDMDQHDRQLLEVSLVCAGDAKVALLDEPTAGQGSQDKHLILAALRKAARSGAAVVWVTHDLDVALSVADRVVALRTGVIAHDAPTASTTIADLLQAFGVAAGKTFSVMPAAAHGLGEIRIYMRMSPSSPEAVSIASGEIVGIASSGVSGARDLLRAAAGLPTKRMFSIDVFGASGSHRVAYMSRERHSEWDFSGKSLRFNLTAGALDALSNVGVMNTRSEVELAESLRQRFSIKAQSLLSDIDELSGGNRQKALLARLAAKHPPVLLLDEPFSGVDAPTRATLGGELRRLADEGTAIAIYSQEWDELGASCDRLAVFRDDESIVNLAPGPEIGTIIESILSGSLSKCASDNTI